MTRLASSSGNGAGWPTFFADSDGTCQMDKVDSMNSSADKSDWPLSGREKYCFAKTSRYSCKSLSRGDFALLQLPQAQFPLAPFPFCQMISPIGRNPIAEWT